MHNGGIGGFAQIKRRLRASLPGPLYSMIEGTTDSEHAFAVFLNVLGNVELRHSAYEMGQALIQTVRQLEQWTADTDSSAPSYYNFAVTDGKSVAAIRYVSEPTVEPASLYYSAGRKYECVNGVCRLVDCEPRESSVVIASERLSEDSSHWTRVAPNHLLTVNEELEVNMQLMEIERPGSAFDLLAARQQGLSMRQ